jgi:hypothetical protein
VFESLEVFDVLEVLEVLEVFEVFEVFEVDSDIEFDEKTGSVGGGGIYTVYSDSV